tara:strand:+ start:622 stop:1002 length:381 start_codon:yes stop_codon:yes gene_type:complete
MENLGATIEIHVTTSYLSEQSNPSEGRYIFAYSIEITNKGAQTVKLLNRHWHIEDDNNKIQEVVGEGVVGQKPEIPPDSSFNYTSGAIIETEFGKMHGSYEMQLPSGEKFKVRIPLFFLSIPRTIH